MKSEALKFWEAAFWWIAVITLIIPLFTMPHIVMGIVFIKLTLFQILVALLLAIYLILWALYPYKYRPQLTWLSIVVIVFAGILIISTIFSVQPFKSFWGDAYRYNGLFSYLHYFIYFLVLSWAIKGKEQWLKLLRWAIVVSFLVALYGIAQYFKLPFVAEPEGGRIMATLSNPLTFAQYILLLFFPTLIYGLKAKNKKFKWFIYGILILQVILLVLTGARGAMIAFMIGLTFFIIYYIWAYYRQLFQKTLVIAIGGLMVVSLLIWGSGQLFKSDNYFLNRITSISLSSPTVQSRINAWKIAWDASSDRLLTGYGLDNFDIAFNKNYKPFAEKFSNSETWFDRSHNSFLDYLVMTGILGMIAYMLLILSAFWQSFKTSMRKKTGWRKHLSVAFVPMLLMYVVFNLSAFDVASVYVVFFFLLAMLNSFDIKEPIKPPIKSLKWGWILYLLSAVVIIGLMPIHSRHILVNKTAGVAVAAFYKKDFTKSTELTNWSLEKNTFMNLAIGNRMIQAGRDLVALPESNVDKDVLLSVGNMFEEIIDGMENGKYYAVLGDYYGQLISIDPTIIEKMELAFERSAQLAPNRPFLYLNWGSILTTGTDRYKEAIDKCQTAISMYPDFPLAYFWLGVSQIADRQFDKGDQSLREASSRGINIGSPESLAVLATAFEKAKEYDKASAIYRQLVSEIGDESSGPYYATLSFYYRIGRYKQAFDLASVYLNKYPNDDVVINLVDKIKEKAPYLK